MVVIFLSYRDFPGEIIVDKYEGWIGIESIDMAAEGGDLGALKRGDKNKRGKENIEDDVLSTETTVGIDSITLHKSVDSSTPSFLAEVFREKNEFSEEVEAKIIVLRAHERAANASSGHTAWHEPFLQLTLKDARVSGHSMNISKDSLSETITLGFSSMEITYTKYVNGKRTGIITKAIMLAK